MFKSQQYRAKATECGELVKSSTSAEESRKFQDLEDRFVSLADNERGLADAFDNAVHIAEQDRSRGAALAAEEEGDLRYRRIRGQVVEDSGAPRADRPISAQAQE